MLLLLFLLSLTQAQNGSYQKLAIKGGILELEFKNNNDNLPLQYAELFWENQVELMDLKMGFKSTTALKNGQVFDNGVSVSLQQKHSPTSKEIDLLSALFSISSKKQYMIKIEELNSFFYSDPNDKFCLQQMEQIIKYFLPCKNRQGLAELINTKVLFTGGYIGVNLKGYKSYYILKIQIELLQNLENLRVTKIKQKCEYFEQSIIINPNGTQSQIENFIFTYSNDNRPSQPSIQDKTILKLVPNNWYQEKQIIMYQINTTNCEKIAMIELIPRGFRVVGVYSIPIRKKIPFWKKRNRESMEIHIQAQTPGDLLQLQISLTADLIEFDRYEAIYGGGEELMRIPIVCHNSNGTSLIQTPSASLHLPEPDFSLPFKVMSFFTAIVGYLWVSTWKLVIKFK